jgi:hypothetical protein
LHSNPLEGWMPTPAIQRHRGFEQFGLSCTWKSTKSRSVLSSLPPSQTQLKTLECLIFLWVDFPLFGKHFVREGRGHFFQEELCMPGWIWAREGNIWTWSIFFSAPLQSCGQFIGFQVSVHGVGDNNSC